MTSADPTLTAPEGPVVLYDKGVGYATITINRPEVLNAVNRAVTIALLEAFDQAEADDEVRAVILTGAGRAFSAGGDITESSARILADAATEQRPSDAAGDDLGPGSVHMKIWGLSKPVIAAVRGYAIGQACELAGVCDLTVAADDARFGEIQIRHGYGPPFLITPFITSLKRAKEILLLGEMMDAQEAKAIGLVNRVVPSDRVMVEAQEMATKLASLPHATVKMNKALINRVYEIGGFRAGVDYRDDQEFMELWTGSQRDQETLSRLRVLQERGWNAFRNERDEQYRGERKP